jgi:hypothetical protein
MLRKANVLFCLAVACGLFQQNVYSQAEKIWDSRFGGNGLDEARDITQANGGGYIIVGSSLSGQSGDKTQLSRGNRDYWVVKMDETGGKVWDRRFGGTDFDQARAVIPAAGGGYIIVGGSKSTNNGDRSQPTLGGFDYWAVRIDEAGNKVWDRRFGFVGDDEARSIVPAAGGGYIIAGYSRTGTPSDKTSDADYYLVKIDDAGNTIWTKRIGGFADDFATALVPAAGGGYIVAGRSNSNISGDKTAPSKGAADFWIVKVDEAGEVVWDQTLGGSGLDEAYALTAAAGGGYIVGGVSASPVSGDKSEGNRGGLDFWITKISETGALVWDKTFGGSADDASRSVIPAADGGYIIGGTSLSSADGDKTEPSQGSSDFWLVKFDEAGAKVWDKRFGGSAEEEGRALVRSLGASYIITGLSYSGISGDRTQSSRINADFWSVRFREACTPFVIDVLADSYICSGATGQFQATGAASYSWAPADHLSAANISNPVFSATDPGNYTYTVTGTDETGCTSTTVVAIEVRANVAVVASAAPDTIIATESTVLSASGATSYTWQPGNLTGASVSVAPAVTTVYTVTGETNGCTSTATVQVVVLPAGFRFVTPSQSIPEGNGEFTLYPYVVQLLGNPTLPATVEVAFSGDAVYGTTPSITRDYITGPFTTNKKITLTFTSVGTQSFNLRIYGNPHAEADNQVIMTLQSPTGASVLNSQKTRVHTILNDDGQAILSFKGANIQRTESNTSVSMVVSYKNAGDHPIPVKFRLTANAPYGAGYTITLPSTPPSTNTFVNGNDTASFVITMPLSAANSQTFTTNIIDNLIHEPNKVLTFELVDYPAYMVLENGQTTRMLTIIDNDPAAPREGGFAESLTAGEALTAYPNPATDRLTVRFRAVQEAAERVEVLDLTGRIVQVQSVQAIEGLNEVTLDLANQPTGVYFVKAVGQTVKVILAH